MSEAYNVARVGVGQIALLRLLSSVDVDCVKTWMTPLPQEDRDRELSYVLAEAVEEIQQLVVYMGGDELLKTALLQLMDRVLIGLGYEETT